MFPLKNNGFGNQFSLKYNSISKIVSQKKYYTFLNFVDVEEKYITENNCHTKGVSSNRTKRIKK